MSFRTFTERLSNWFAGSYIETDRLEAEKVVAYDAFKAAQQAAAREDRRQALADYRERLERGDTRGQRSAQVIAMRATNAALRGGV